MGDTRKYLVEVKLVYSDRFPMKKDARGIIQIKAIVETNMNYDEVKHRFEMMYPSPPIHIAEIKEGEIIAKV